MHRATLVDAQLAEHGVHLSTNGSEVRGSAGQDLFA
jgi:hypothetical protein